MVLLGQLLSVHLCCPADQAEKGPGNRRTRGLNREFYLGSVTESPKPNGAPAFQAEERIVLSQDFRNGILAFCIPEGEPANASFGFIGFSWIAEEALGY